MDDLNLYLYCYNLSKDKKKVLENCYKANPNFNEEKTFKELKLMVKNFKICRMKRRKIK
jgi:hypothetical protein